MKWEVQDINELSNDFWSQWDLLSTTYHLDNPMLAMRFVKRLIEYFPQKVYAAIALDEQDNAIAIKLLRYNGRFVWQSYKPSQSQISLTVIKPDMPICIRSLIKQLPHFCIKLDLMSLDPHEHLGIINSLDHKFISPYAENMVVNIIGSFDNYWSRRAKSLKKNVRRYFNRLETETVYEFVIKDSPEDIRLGVAKYGMIESRGWKGEIGTALHPGNVQGNFYESLLLDFAEKNAARVFELVIDGEVVASRLCSFSDEMLVIFKTTYEESYKRYAVGRVLLYLVIEYVFKHKLTKDIDFYTNASRDQLEWSTGQRSIVNASCYRHGWISSIVPMVKTLKDKVVRN